MQKEVNAGLSEMSVEEMELVDGGFWGAFFAGALVDGVTKAFTGKSCGDWVAYGLKKTFAPINCY